MMVLNFEDSLQSWELKPVEDAKGDELYGVAQYSAYNALAEWELLPPMVELFRQVYEDNLSVSLDKNGKLDENSLLGRPDERPAMLVKVIAKRNWERMLWTVGYVVAALGVLGNGAFYVDISETGDPLSIILTDFLALCAFQTTVDSFLPNMSYMTVFQAYMIAMNMAVIVQGVQVVYTAALGWETGEDEHFFVINCWIWLGCQITFLLWACFWAIPQENKKEYETTNWKELRDSNKIGVRRPFVKHQLKQRHAHGQKRGGVQEVQRIVETGTTLLGTLRAGDKVEARFRVAGADAKDYYPGKIKSVNKDGTYYIIFDKMQPCKHEPCTKPALYNGYCQLHGGECAERHYDGACEGDCQHEGYEVPYGVWRRHFMQSQRKEHIADMEVRRKIAEHGEVQGSASQNALISLLDAIKRHKAQIGTKSFSQTPLTVDSARSYQAALQACASPRQSETAETIAHVFEDLGLERQGRTSEFKLANKNKFYRLLKLLGKWRKDGGAACRALGATEAPYLERVDIADIRKEVSDVVVYKQALCDTKLAMARLSEARVARTNPTVRSKQPSSWVWDFLCRQMQGCWTHTRARCCGPLDAPNTFEGGAIVQWRQRRNRTQEIGDVAWEQLRDSICMKVFDAFDIDGDGEIIPQEVQRVYSSTSTDGGNGAYDALVDLVLAADKDENGKVTRAEWQRQMNLKRDNEGAPSTAMLRLMKQFAAKREVEDKTASRS